MGRKFCTSCATLSRQKNSFAPHTAHGAVRRSRDTQRVPDVITRRKKKHADAIVILSYFKCKCLLFAAGFSRSTNCCRACLSQTLGAGCADRANQTLMGSKTLRFVALKSTGRLGFVSFFFVLHPERVYGRRVRDTVWQNRTAAC